MVKLNSLQKSFFLLVLGFSLSFACVACGDDEDNELFDDPNQDQNNNSGGDENDEPFQEPNQEQTDAPSLPTDSIAGGEDEPMIPADSILVSDSHEAVDLGLSVKWATCNVGASSPEEYGDYFAWGETTTKSSYYESNSTVYGLSISELQSRGIIGSDGNLAAAYDAATVNWGSKWRMPTWDEINELKEECTWEWTTQSGVKGRKVTGPNGNSIFLPAAGSWYYTYLGSAGSVGYYWSATPNYFSNFVYYLLFSSDYYRRDLYNRFYGYSVRPVSDELLSGSEK